MVQMQNNIKIALVGRPNVGKSALFNRICGKRLSIVDEREGVTRDRLYGEGDFFGRPFTLIDTGGLDTTSGIPFADLVFFQTQLAIEEADSLIMVVDARSGVTQLDLEVARLLKQTQKPLCLAVNKIDSTGQEELLFPFHALGIEYLFPVSAMQGNRLVELLEKALTPCVQLPLLNSSKERIKVAIIGRPNVGKSTLINAFAHALRVISSPIPGTTRDAVDVVISHAGKEMIVIDTAGIRRKKAEHEVVDKFAAMRTQAAIERADLCLVMLDAQAGITTQDKKILNQVEEAGKGCVFFFNKWDLCPGFSMDFCVKSLQIEASFVSRCPILFGSAQTGKGLKQIFPMIEKVYHNLKRRISTGRLNKVIEKALQKTAPPRIQGRRLRIYYMTQIDTMPPRFICFVNKPSLMAPSYQHYLINQLRSSCDFLGAPLVFYLRCHARTECVDLNKALGGN